MIGVDWGTTSFRAFRIARDGDNSRPPHRAARPGQRAGQPLRRHAARRDRPLARRRRGPRAAVRHDRQPAGLEGGALSALPGRRRRKLPPPWWRSSSTGAQVKLVPGLSADDEAGVAEVMRGEETQVFGVLEAMGGSGLACLPGTHSKWVRVEGGRIIGFTTHMTGEAFGALRGHTILGRMMREGPAGRRAVRCGRAAVGRSRRAAAPHLRRALAGAGGAAGRDRGRRLPLRHPDRPRGARGAGGAARRGGARDRRAGTDRAVCAGDLGAGRISPSGTTARPRRAAWR